MIKMNEKRESFTKKGGNMKKILLITLAVGLFVLSGCKATEKYGQPAIKADMPMTGHKMMETKSTIAGEKTQIPGIIDKTAWHYSIYDPLTKEIKFYDQNNNMLWRNFRY